MFLFRSFRARLLNAGLPWRAPLPLFSLDPPNLEPVARGGPRVQHDLLQSISTSRSILIQQ